MVFSCVEGLSSIDLFLWEGRRKEGGSDYYNKKQGYKRSRIRFQKLSKWSRSSRFIFRSERGALENLITRDDGQNSNLPSYQATLWVEASLRATWHGRHSHKVQSSARRASLAQRSQEKTRTSHQEWDGAGMPEHELKLSSSSSGGTLVANLFSSPNEVLIHYSFLTLFRSSPLPCLLLSEPCSCNPQSPFLSFYFLVHSRKNVLTKTAKGYDPKTSSLCFTLGKADLLSAQFHTWCWRLQLPDKISAS